MVVAKGLNSEVRMNSSLMPRPLSITDRVSVPGPSGRRRTSSASTSISPLSLTASRALVSRLTITLNIRRRSTRTRSRTLHSTSRRTPSRSPSDRPVAVTASSSISARSQGSGRTSGGRATLATWLISSLRFATVRSMTAMASRWKSGLARWRRAFSTTSDRPDTWFLMSCSTKLDSRCSDSSWRVSARISAWRANHSAAASWRAIAPRNSTSS